MVLGPHILSTRPTAPTLSKPEELIAFLILRKPMKGKEKDQIGWDHSFLLACWVMVEHKI